MDTQPPGAEQPSPKQYSEELHCASLVHGKRVPGGGIRHWSGSDVGKQNPVMAQQSSAAAQSFELPHNVTRRAAPPSLAPPAPLPPSVSIVSPHPAPMMLTMEALARQAVCMFGYVLPSQPQTLQVLPVAEQLPQLPIGLQCPMPWQRPESMMQNWRVPHWALEAQVGRPQRSLSGVGRAQASGFVFGS